jgi:hypothetical protein
MKIDGEGRRERAAANAVTFAQTASAQALVESFRATLQRFRRPDRDDTKSRPGARDSNRATVRVADRARERATDRASDRGTDGATLPAPGFEEMREAPAGAVSDGASHLRFLPQPAKAHSAKPAPAAEFQAAPRPPRVGGVGSAPASCIEVVHQRTGTRFVLSREGDTWLLAIKSDNAPHRAELASIVAMLNAQFATRGLGPVDIILG